jgi:hypothetical protein
MTPFNPIPSLILLTVLMLTGIALGQWQWRQHGLWLVLAAVLMLCLAGAKLWFPWWTSDPPLSWLLAGRKECYWMALASPLLLWGLISIVRSPVLRGVVIFAVSVILIRFAYLPVAAVLWGEAAALSDKSQVDKDGVCHQSTGITCGPAAGVTVLKRLGIEIGEREFAMACGTSSCGGTSAALMAHTLQEQFDGKLQVKLVHYDSVDHLPDIGNAYGCYALAVIKFSPFVDHFVALLDRQGDTISLGDPMTGLQKMSVADFAKT